MQTESFRLKLLSLNRIYKTIIGMANDLILFYLSLKLSLFFILDPQIEHLTFYIVGLNAFVGVIFFSWSGIYRTVVRFINFDFLWDILKGLLVFSIFLFVLLSLLKTDQTMKIVFLNLLLSSLLITASRVIVSRLLLNETGSSRVAIYGAGSAGVQLAGALRFSEEMKPIFFVDEKKSLYGNYVAGLKVIRPNALIQNIKKRKIDEVLIAIPSAPRQLLQDILKEIENYSIKVRILPGVAELAQGKISVSSLKEVAPEDLLGRVQVKPDKSLIERNVKGKNVLVTGAGGSIGAGLSRQVLSKSPNKLIILDSNEFSLYLVKQELQDKPLGKKVKSVLGSVTNKKRLLEVCSSFSIDTIYHAAAYKHVSLVEENAFEGVTNNIFGTLNCVEAAVESGVETFVLISTDKAVRPTNIMGATKRFSELILQAFAEEKSKHESTKITMVRFGNVLDSSGSAIPLFREQIKKGGPVTVTDPEVIRYFMTITEATELVIQAGAMGEGGDVFVLDMGEPIKILQLAEKLIRLSGLQIKDDKNPNGDIEIEFTGLRHGEKLFEELLIGGNVEHTSHPKIYRAVEEMLPWKKVDSYLAKLKEAEKSSDHKLLRKILTESVSGFEPKGEVVDVLKNID